DELSEAGVDVHAIGKVGEMFTGRGVASSHRAPDNQSAIAVLDRLVEELDTGLVFANLIDTDQVYGHRKDVHGFHRALREIDAATGRWLASLTADDLLVLT